MGGDDMIATELIAQVKRIGGNIRVDGENLKLTAAEPIPEDIMRAIRESKADILSELRNLSAPDLSRYEAALQQGTRVICRHCIHYKGPHSKALGWCRKFDTDTAPDVPFTCGAASRA